MRFLRGWRRCVCVFLFCFVLLSWSCRDFGEWRNSGGSSSEDRTRSAGWKKFGRTARKVWRAPQIFLRDMARWETYSEDFVSGSGGSEWKSTEDSGGISLCFVFFFSARFESPLPPLTRCLPRLGAPLLDFTGCFASGLPGSRAPGPCCPRTGRYLRTNARKPQLARPWSTTHAWDRLCLTRTLLWSWRRTPAPKRRLMRSWPCGLVSFNVSFWSV